MAIKKKTTVAPASTSKEKRKDENKAALFIPAGLLLGMGFGFFIDQLVGGLFFGLGSGMLVFAILTFIKK